MADPKNCFVLWWIIWGFFSIYFARINSWESRDPELVTSAATSSRQSWRRCKTAVNWPPVTAGNQQALGTGIICLDIACFPLLPFLSSVNIPLFFLFQWQQYWYCQNTPETHSALTSVLHKGLSGRDSRELPPYLMAEVNAAMCQPRGWELWSDQLWCPRAAGGCTPECLKIKEGPSSCAPAGQGLHMVVQGSSQGVGAVPWSSLVPMDKQSLPQCLGLYCLSGVTSCFNLDFPRASCGTRSLNPSVEFVCAAFAVPVHCDRKPNSVPNAPGTCRKTILEARAIF